jgi:hypothetical protein
MFEHFYYIPPHAVERFKERVMDVSTYEARQIILRNMQQPEYVKEHEWNHTTCKVFKGVYGGKSFYIPLMLDKNKIANDSTVKMVIPTILTEEMIYHRKEQYTNQEKIESLAVENYRKGKHWTPRDDEYLKYHYNGHNADRIAKALERTTYSVQRRATTLKITDKRKHIASSSVKNLLSWNKFHMYFRKMRIEEKEIFVDGKRIPYGESGSVVLLNKETFFQLCKKNSE